MKSEIKLTGNNRLQKMSCRGKEEPGRILWRRSSFGKTETDGEALLLNESQEGRKVKQRRG
jgi:hypothetical protein